MTITIAKVIVVRPFVGTDRIYLQQSQLPNACYPYDGHVDLQFDVARGTAESYLRRHLPDIPVEVLDYSMKRRTECPSGPSAAATAAPQLT
jgi:hypothetical protein